MVFVIRDLNPDTKLLYGSVNGEKGRESSGVKVESFVWNVEFLWKIQKFGGKGRK